MPKINKLLKNNRADLTGQFEGFDGIRTGNAFAAVVNLGFAAKYAFSKYDDAAHRRQNSGKQGGGIVVVGHFVFLENGSGKSGVVQNGYRAKFDQHMQGDQ